MFMIISLTAIGFTICCAVGYTLGRRWATFRELRKADQQMRTEQIISMRKR